MFHTIMMYIQILNKRFSNDGLCDVLIQRGTIAEGSINKALIGKMYNSMLMYKAIMSKVILNHVEIGKDIYYKVHWHDDLDFKTF